MGSDNAFAAEYWCAGFDVAGPHGWVPTRGFQKHRALVIVG